MTQETNWEVIRKVARILIQRGLSQEAGMNITLRVEQDPQAMLDWLEQNPEATGPEMAQKAREIHRQQRNRPTAPTMPTGETL